MARWYLTAPHYLKTTIPTEWMYNETDRFTGKTKVRKFNVPAYLNPNDPNDWNYKGDSAHGIKDVDGDPDMGYIVVCLPGRGQGRDIEIEGTPTPDMTPIDDEARAITAEYAKHWVHPMGEDALPAQGASYTESLLANLQGQVADLAGASRSPRDAARDEMIEKLLESQQATQAQLMTILAALVPAAKASPDRRI